MFLARDNHFSAQLLSRTALIIAMTTVLGQIHFFKMPQGGEVNIGTMVPLILLAYCYGSRVTLLAGFICGTINLMVNPYFYHPVQVLFDYPFPYMAMAVMALFKKRIILGTVVAFFLKFMCHFISGVVFFGAYAPEGTSPVIYSAVYNAATIVPDLIICCIILHFLPVKRIIKAMKDESI
ncbi:Substrate-specific component ThiT of thiamin ECF transporter [Anaerovibrio sp. JC8]|uniref:energy-coupled thiamine transporter ThiT n=1 Tax=Anaerovibrio sp. JC8 TaxID=1240085 RepID=UPI000A0D8DAA|nr:energy-coupled thiamine transporter ThiT [Anaerovibrio sp. JC8]ORU00057.1 Substrate-specific component ThiT of thiamin ECF transporter [Anaerovibrio sp. JC8]